MLNLALIFMEIAPTWLPELTTFIQMIELMSSKEKIIGRGIVIAIIWNTPKFTKILFDGVYGLTKLRNERHNSNMDHEFRMSTLNNNTHSFSITANTNTPNKTPLLPKSTIRPIDGID